MKRTLNLWLLLVLAVCGLSWWFGRGMDLPAGISAPVAALTDRLTGGTDAQPAALPTAAAGVTADPIHVIVLNGTPQAGLAKEFGLLLARTGCVTGQVGNAAHTRYPASFLVNRQLDEERAGRLALALGGIPVLREFDPRAVTDVVLVLGADAEAVRARLLKRGGS